MKWPGGLLTSGHDEPVVFGNAIKAADHSGVLLKRAKGPAGYSKIWLCSCSLSYKNIAVWEQCLVQVTLALTGAIYAVAPDLTKDMMACWHVILHNTGLPIMLVALTAYLSGITAAEPGIAIGAVISTLGFGAITLTIWRAL